MLLTLLAAAAVLLPGNAPDFKCGGAATVPGYERHALMVADGEVRLLKSGDDSPIRPEEVAHIAVRCWYPATQSFDAEPGTAARSSGIQTFFVVSETRLAEARGRLDPFLAAQARHFEATGRYASNPLHLAEYGLISSPPLDIATTLDGWTLTVDSNGAYPCRVDMRTESIADQVCWLNLESASEAIGRIYDAALEESARGLTSPLGGGVR